MAERVYQLFTRVDVAWFLEIFLLALSWAILCRGKKTLRQFFLHVVILFCALSLGRTLLFLLIYEAGNSFLIGWGYLHGLLSAAYLWRFSRFETRTKILLWITLYTAVLSIAALAGECSMLLSSYSALSSISGIARCAVYLLMPLTAVYLRKYNFDAFTVIPNSGLLFVFTLCVCVQILCIVETLFFGASTQMLLTFIAVYSCMTITSLTSIQALFTMCREQRDLSELQVEKQRYLAEKEITKIAETSLEDLRIIRHDIKNQYSYMQILLQEERYSELRDYFAKLQDNLPQQLNIIDCGNHTVNTVLNMEFSKLRSKGIPFEHQLVVPPALPFKAVDVCSILSNLLDNAADECYRIKTLGRSDVKIRIEIYPHQSYLLIRCMNSTDRTELPRRGPGLLTTKTDSNLHGFGTKIIVKLAEKYNGCADFTLSDGTFIAQVMLDITGGGPS